MNCVNSNDRFYMKNKWTQQQKNIHEGLTSIGKEIAGFYEAGLNIYYGNYGNFPNGSNFLMHAAREIDGGLRDVLSIDFARTKGEEGWNKKSIFCALDMKQSEEFASEWCSAISELHKFAHRHGAWKDPRGMAEVNDIWIKYEGVLEKLVGSYYSIIERIERIRRLKTLEGGPFEVLCNILSISFYSNYFFRKETDVKWFSLLKEKLYFSAEKIKFDKNGNALFWEVLDYLERVSEQVAQNIQYGKELIDIIESIVQFSLTKKKRINNYHIWWYCVKILNNLPSAIIKKNLAIEMFSVWLSVWTDHSMRSDLSSISDIGKKLLPKFLHDDFRPNNYVHAEEIIYAITAIRDSGKLDAFTKREYAVLAWQSYQILDAFRNHGQQIGQKCSVSVFVEIADRLRNVLEYKHKDSYTNLEIENAVYRLKVSRIFADDLKPGKIKFKDDEYECVIKQFSKEQLEGVDREKYFWAIHIPEPQIECGRFVFTALTKDFFATEIKNNLPDGINWQGVDGFEQKILNVHKELYSDNSYIWCKTLKSGPEHDNGAAEVLTIILKDVLLAKCKCDTNREAVKKILNSFLNDNKYQFLIFRRFVLLCVDEFWSEYFEFFYKLIEVVPTVLEGSDFEVEMQDILLHHNYKFNLPLKEKLKTLIDNVPEYYVNKGEKSVAYWKYKWLSPLRENPYFSDLYEEAKQKYEPKDGKPYEPNRLACRVGAFGLNSPITKEDILQKPVAGIVQYLADFKDEEWYDPFEGDPDKEGLAAVLHAAVKDEPKKFTDELNAFMSVDYFYLYRIFWGLKEAWNAGIEINWQNIFDFSLSYLNRGKDIITNESLMAQGKDRGKGRYIWIVGTITDLIDDGSRDDARAFAQKHFDKVEQIFDLIIPLLKGEKRHETQRDAITYASNTPLGRTIRAYISFSLMVARATQKKKENWGCDKFERFLPIGIDGYIWFGCYLSQMKYFDNKYTVEKINSFAQRDSIDYEWQMFMEGYLTWSQIYEDLYGLMRANYIKAIQSTIFEGRVDKRLVEHICIGYLQLGEALAQNNEDGQPSLFWKMLDEADTADKRSRWETVANFFWSKSGRTLKKDENDDHGEPSEDFKEKILAFWEWTFNEQGKIKEKLGESYSSFLSRMVRLTIWLDKIDETTEKWLLLSAPCIEIQHCSSCFIKYLTKFDDKDSIKRIGKIFLKVLESSTPTFSQEEIQLIVERLYKIGEKDSAIKLDANDICNTYGRRGLHFLKTLWEKYNRDRVIN